MIHKIKNLFFTSVRFLCRCYYKIKGIYNQFFKKKTLPSVIYRGENYISIELENLSDKIHKIDIFSFSNMHLPEGVLMHINGPGGNIHDILFSIKSMKDKVVNGFKYFTSNSEIQFNEVINFTYRDPFGRLELRRVKPSIYVNIKQTQSFCFEAPQYRFDLNDILTIGVTLHPKNKITFILNIEDKLLNTK